MPEDIFIIAGLTHSNLPVNIVLIEHDGFFFIHRAISSSLSYCVTIFLHIDICNAYVMRSINLIPVYVWYSWLNGVYALVTGLTKD